MSLYSPAMQVISLCGQHFYLLAIFLDPKYILKAIFNYVKKTGLLTQTFRFGYWQFTGLFLWEFYI